MRHPPQTLEIPVADGHRLHASLHRSRSRSPAPAVLIQTPYGRGTLPPVLFEPFEDASVLVVDWRGRGPDGLRPTAGGMLRRGRDGAALVAWLADQEWCDGRVATWGASALGAIQFRTAAAHPAALRCGVALVATLGWQRENFFEGGVLKREYVEHMESIGFPVRGILEQHPLDGEFWNLDVRPAPRSLRVPFLLVAGWFDVHIARMLADFAGLQAGGDRAVRGRHRLLIGPWTHTGFWSDRQGGLLFPGAASTLRGVTRRFLRRWLGDSPRDRQEELPVHYWQMGSDVWRSCRSWPPGNGQVLQLDLQAGGGLARGPAAPLATAFVHDPGDPLPTQGGANLSPAVKSGPRPLQDSLLDRADALVWTSEPLEEDLEVAGSVQLALTVSSTTAAPHVAARLADVHPDGRTWLVCDGIRDVSRETDTWTHEPLATGEQRALTVELGPTAMTWKRGHRLRLVVGGSNAPRFATAEEACRTTLHRGALLLPLSRGTDRTPETSSG